MMIYGFLDVIMADAERQVAWSIIFSNMCFLQNFKSIATHSRNCDVMGNPTNGLGEGFLNIWQVLHSFVTFKISAFRFSSFLHSWPTVYLLDQFVWCCVCKLSMEFHCYFFIWFVACKSESDISADYIQQTVFFLWNTKKTDRCDINERNTHTTHRKK